jgi:hypothetical protein
VVKRSPGRGAFVAYVSWNGATRVATWRIEAGGSGSALSSVKHVPRPGFETSVRFISDGATAFKVPACDHKGKLLGSSRVVPA